MGIVKIFYYHIFLSHLVICDPPCQNGGVCRKSGRCKCLTGYKGAQCQMEREEKNERENYKQKYKQSSITTRRKQLCTTKKHITDLFAFFPVFTRSQYYILRKIHIWRNDSAT